MKAILAALLFGTLTTGVFAKDLKVVAPESVGMSTERLARLGKAMQEDIVALYFTQYMPSDFSVIGRFQTLVYQALVD
jgi:hypothetical protein